jgi:hypothetical protein
MRLSGERKRPENSGAHEPKQTLGLRGQLCLLKTELSRRLQCAEGLFASMFGSHVEDVSTGILFANPPCGYKF